MDFANDTCNCEPNFSFLNRVYIIRIYKINILISIRND